MSTYLFFKVELLVFLQGGKAHSCILQLYKAELIGISCGAAATPEADHR